MLMASSVYVYLIGKGNLNIMQHTWQNPVKQFLKMMQVTCRMLRETMPSNHHLNSQVQKLYRNQPRISMKYRHHHLHMMDR